LLAARIASFPVASVSMEKADRAFMSEQPSPRLIRRATRPAQGHRRTETSFSDTPDVLRSGSNFSVLSAGSGRPSLRKKRDLHHGRQEMGSVAQIGQLPNPPQMMMESARDRMTNEVVTDEMYQGYPGSSYGEQGLDPDPSGSQWYTPGLGPYEDGYGQRFGGSARLGLGYGQAVDIYARVYDEPRWQNGPPRRAFVPPDLYGGMRSPYAANYAGFEGRWGLRAPGPGPEWYGSDRGWRYYGARSPLVAYVGVAPGANSGLFRRLQVPWDYRRYQDTEMRAGYSGWPLGGLAEEHVEDPAERRGSRPSDMVGHHM